MNNSENSTDQQQQYDETHQQSSYASATAIVSDDQQSRALVNNMADFYAQNPYVYMPDTNLIQTQTLPANFFPPAAYFPTGAPDALNFLWTPFSFDMVWFLRKTWMFE